MCTDNQRSFYQVFEGGGGWDATGSGGIWDNIINVVEFNGLKNCLSADFLVNLTGSFMFR